MGGGWVFELGPGFVMDTLCAHQSHSYISNQLVTELHRGAPGRTGGENENNANNLYTYRGSDPRACTRGTDLEGSPKNFPPFFVYLGRTEGSRRSQVDQDGFQGRD